MRSRFLHFVSILVILVPLYASSQQNGDKAQSSTPTVESQLQKHHYKLTFLLKEMDSDKVLNQRTFTVGVGATDRRDSNDRAMLRVGNRVPISTDKDVQYIDVGVNIDASQLIETDGGLQMSVSVDISSLAAELPKMGAAPALRQVRSNSAIVAPVGKPTTVFTADDPASMHKFILEVTVTPLR